MNKVGVWSCFVFEITFLSSVFFFFFFFLRKSFHLIVIQRAPRGKGRNWSKKELTFCAADDGILLLGNNFKDKKTSPFCRDIVGSGTSTGWNLDDNHPFSLVIEFLCDNCATFFDNWKFTLVGHFSWKRSFGTKLVTHEVGVFVLFNRNYKGLTVQKNWQLITRKRREHWFFVLMWKSCRTFSFFLSLFYFFPICLWWLRGEEQTSIFLRKFM